MGSETSSLRAAIDIGSNTVLLLVGQLKNGRVETLFEAQEAPRLGKGVDEEHNLDPESVNKVITVLKEYKSILKRDFGEVRDVIVTATSAVRDAANQQEFLDKVKKETGFSVQVLSGKEEAGYTYFGAKSVLDDLPGTCCVLDIGGGSTEVALGSKQILTERFSYNIGSVRFTERYLDDDPPANHEVRRCRSAIKDALKQKIFYLPTKVTLVGVAGTVTSLAHMQMGLQTYQPQKINGRRLSVQTVGDWIEKLQGRSSDQLLKEYPEILKGRADVVMGGLLILHGFMKTSKISDIVVSTGGIRHGALVMDNNKKGRRSAL